MKLKFKWTMIPVVIGAANTALIAFGVYHLSNEQLQALDTLVSVILTGFGVVVNHQE